MRTGNALQWSIDPFSQHNAAASSPVLCGCFHKTEAREQRSLTRSCAHSKAHSVQRLCTVPATCYCNSEKASPVTHRMAAIDATTVAEVTAGAVAAAVVAIAGAAIITAIIAAIIAANRCVVAGYSPRLCLRAAGAAVGVTIHLTAHATSTTCAAEVIDLLTEAAQVAVVGAGGPS